METRRDGEPLIGPMQAAKNGQIGSVQAETARMPGSDEDASGIFGNYDEDEEMGTWDDPPFLVIFWDVFPWSRRSPATEERE